MVCFPPVLALTRALTRAGRALAQLLVRNQTSRPSCAEPPLIALPCLREGSPSLLTAVAWHGNGMHSRAAPQPSIAAGELHQREASVCRSQSSAPSAQLHRDRGRLSQIAMYLDNASFDTIPATRLTATLQYQVGSTTAIVLKTAPSLVQESRISRHFLFDPSHAASSRQRILRLPALHALRAMDPNPLPLPSQASAKLRRRSYGKPSFRVRRVQKRTPEEQCRSVH